MRIESVDSAKLEKLVLELSVHDGADWETLFSDGSLKHLEENMLPQFIARQRWFGGKSRHIVSTSVLDWGLFDNRKSALLLIDVTYHDGDVEKYLVPLGMSFGTAAVEVQEKFPDAVLSTITSPHESGVLREGMFSESALLALLALIANGDSIPMRNGMLRGLPSSIFSSLRGYEDHLSVRRGSAEQSNSSVFFGDRLIMKLFRKQQPGINPDTEIGRYLTEHTGFLNIAPFGGSIEYAPGLASGAATYTLAMLQGLVANEGDGWEWTLNELDRYFESTIGAVFPQVEAREAMPDRVLKSIRPYLDAASTLGRRTGELHVALGQPTTDRDFSPEPFTTSDAVGLHEKVWSNAIRAFDALKESVASQPEETAKLVGVILGRREIIFDRLGAVASTEFGGQRTRVHGDYHLGQVLRTGSDFVILDFEGEPARSLAERRSKQSPLKDVAGMLRSFSYAAFAGLTRFTDRKPYDVEGLVAWAGLWERAVSAEFLKAYRLAVGVSPIVPSLPGPFHALLDTYVLDKALYELVYELNNRPTWVRIPLHGILSLMPSE